MSRKFASSTQCEYCCQSADYFNSLRVNEKLPGCPDAPVPQTLGKLPANICVPFVTQ